MCCCVVCVWCGAAYAWSRKSKSRAVLRHRRGFSMRNIWLLRALRVYPMNPRQVRSGALQATENPDVAPSGMRYNGVQPPLPNRAHSVLRGQWARSENVENTCISPTSSHNPPSRRPRTVSVLTPREQSEQCLLLACPLVDRWQSLI